LAVQSQNGINVLGRLALAKEVSALKSEITRISSDTQFGKTDILKGYIRGYFLSGCQLGVKLSDVATKQSGALWVLQV